MQDTRGVLLSFIGHWTVSLKRSMPFGAGYAMHALDRQPKLPTESI
jgi:hypothetical protein